MNRPTVKRYRRRDLVNEVLATYPPEEEANMRRKMGQWSDNYLTFVHRDTTGKELVRHPGGIWYGLAEDEDE